MTVDYEIAADWDHAHRYSPAPRHRRKMIMSIIKKLKFSDCLDAGCAQPYLLQEVTHRFQVKGYGCDISKTVVQENQKSLPACEFKVLDLEKEKWPHEKQFDLVISSEVIEHIKEWKAALKNIAKMSKRYMLITVPGGKIRKIDRMVGHFCHFNGDELISQIESEGFTCVRFIRHGFPMHSIYKRLINFVAPEKMYGIFQGNKYSSFQIIISNIIYYIFYLNYVFFTGSQLFVLAERKQ